MIKTAFVFQLSLSSVLDSRPEIMEKTNDTLDWKFRPSHINLHASTAFISSHGLKAGKFLQSKRRSSKEIYKHLIFLLAGAFVEGSFWGTMSVRVGKSCNHTSIFSLAVPHFCLHKISKFYLYFVTLEYDSLAVFFTHRIAPMNDTRHIIFFYIFVVFFVIYWSIKKSHVTRTKFCANLQQKRLASSFFFQRNRSYTAQRVWLIR